MPIYEFICAECEADFEKLVASSAASKSVRCPYCGSKKVHKKFSVFGVGAKSSSGGGLASFGGGGASCAGST